MVGGDSKEFGEGGLAGCDLPKLPPQRGEARCGPVGGDGLKGRRHTEQCTIIRPDVK